MIFALFLIETEYIAIKKTRKKILWIAQFLTFMNYRLPNHLVNFKVNNKKVIFIVANSKIYWHTKYIKIKYYWMKKNIKSKKIAIIYIFIKDIVLDKLIKALNPKFFKAFWIIIEMH